MQIVTAIGPRGFETQRFPSATTPIGLDALVWGRHDELCTPAYWAAQAWMLGQEQPDHYRLGTSLEEEALACILGGHGMPAEIGLAAYSRLRDIHVEDPGRLRNDAEVEALLREPLSIRGRAVRYRFPVQKARFVAAAMATLPTLDHGLDDRALRDSLTRIPGIGPKTASWIVRNWRGSDEVSILDVHILRAGRILRIFEERHTVERHYRDLEAAFLHFAECIETRASILDSVMWLTMRGIPQAILKGMIDVERPSSAGHAPIETALGALTPG